jgi:hypothetical protein
MMEGLDVDLLHGNVGRSVLAEEGESWRDGSMMDRCSNKNDVARLERGMRREGREGKGREGKEREGKGKERRSEGWGRKQ